MTGRIPDKIYSLYGNLSTKDKLYLKLRWKLCPFKKISEYIPKKGLILDVGCGVGMLANLLAIGSEKRKVFGVDLSKNRIKIAKNSIGDRKNINFKLMNVIDFKPKGCKGAVMSDFLHHISYEIQENIIKKVYEKLNKDGVLVIQDVDTKPRLKFMFVYFLDHILNPRNKIYYRDRSNYVKLLEKIGFKVETKEAHKRLPLSDIIYICKKN